MNREFRYLGQGVYTRQREFSAEELATTKVRTLTEVVMFDRFVLPTEDDILVRIQTAALSLQNDYSNALESSKLKETLRALSRPEITECLAKREAKLYETLKSLVPALPRERGYTHFVRAQTGYLPGEQERVQLDPDSIVALRDTQGLILSMKNPENRAGGYGISGRIEVAINDNLTIRDGRALKVLMSDNVRRSNTVAVYGMVDKKLLFDLYDQVIALEFGGNLHWLPHVSENICENMALQTVGLYLQQLRLQREAETIFGAAVWAVSEMIEDGFIPRDHSLDQERVN